MGLPSCLAVLIRVSDRHKNAILTAAPEGIPFSSRDRGICGLGLSSVCPQRGRCRGSFARTRCDHQPRNRSSMGQPLWPPLRRLHSARQAGAVGKWHLDEVVIPSNGRIYWPWQAVDAKGDVLDIFVQPQRNAKVGRQFFIRLIGRFGEPRVVITGKLRSYFSRVYNLAPGADHRARKGLNDRIEGSHRPARKREKLVGRFKSPRQAQRFLAAHDQINTVFRPLRYQLSVVSYRYARADAFDLWKGYTTEMSA